VYKNIEGIKSDLLNQNPKIITKPKKKDEISEERPKNFFLQENKGITPPILKPVKKMKSNVDGLTKLLSTCVINERSASELHVEPFDQILENIKET
jgi:hypothetical protein